MRTHRLIPSLISCLLAALVIGGLCGCGSGSKQGLHISATEVTNNIAPGGTARWTVNVNQTNLPFTELTYSVQGLPVGATTNFPITTSHFGSSSSSADMTVTVPTSLTPGTYHLTIVVVESDGEGLEAQDAVEVDLVVTAPGVPGFTLSVSPAAFTFESPGQSREFTYTVTPTNGFTGTVEVVVAGLAVEGGDLVLTEGPHPQPLNITGTAAVSGKIRLTYQPVGTVSPTVNVLLYGNGVAQTHIVATLIPPGTG